MDKNFMHIGLVDTGDKTFSLMPNIGLASLAASLINAGHSVEALDLYFSDDAMQENYLKKSFDLVGISCTSFSFITAVQVARVMKRYSPNNKIVLGGPHVSVARSEVLEEKSIDFAIYGEGEVPLLSLIELLKRENDPSPEMLKEIPSLIFRDDVDIRINLASKRIRDLDSLPFPIYDIFQVQQYDTYPLSSSRGCPYNCVYCASSAIMGTTWIKRSPESMIAEIKHTITKWGKKRFYMIDDSFNLDENRVKIFCSLLINEKLYLKWGACGIRADKTDPDMLKLMKLSGCDSVCVGIESANQDVLEGIGKQETIQQIEDGVYKIHDAGISICGMFMIGNPGDTLETVRQSIEFAKKMPLDTIRFYLALPFPQTGLWDYVEKHGSFLRTDYVNFHDYSDTPLFETKEFTRQERILAYKEAVQVMFPNGLPDKLRYRDNGFTVEEISQEGERIKPRFSPQ